MSGSIIKPLIINDEVYKKLDYLGCDNNNAYIKTGINVRTNTLMYDLIVECEFAFNSITSTAQAFGKNSAPYFFIGINTSGNYYSGIGSSYQNTDIHADTNFHKFRLEYISGKGKFYIDDSLVTDYGSLGTGENSGEFYLFRIWTATGQYFAQGKCKYLKCLWINEPYRDFIPIEKEDGTIGLYDLVTNKFYGNNGSGVFTKGNYIKVEHIYKMPLITKDGEEVVKVDYIESTDRKNFYINTGYAPNQNSKIVYDFEITNWGGASSGGFTNQYGALFGKRAANHATDSWVICRNAGNNSMRCEIGNGNFGITPTFALNTRHKVISEYNKITFDNTEISIGGSAKTYSNLELFLFGINHNGSPDADFNSMVQKLYDVEIYEGAELIRHFIPVKYGTEYCMLDLVENKLYHNKGRGVFTGGSRVEVSKIKNLSTGKEIIMGGD